MPIKLKTNKKNNNVGNNRDVKSNTLYKSNEENLSWIDDMQKDLDKTLYKSQANKKLKSNKVLSSKTSKSLSNQEINLLDDDSDDDSYSDTNIQNSKLNIKNKITSNRFEFVNSDTESDTEDKTDDKSINKTDDKSIQNINLIPDKNPIKLVEETKLSKLSKKQKSQVKHENKEKEIKSQYKFDLNNNSKTVNSTGKTNNLTTLYSEDIEVLIAGKTLIYESNITINSGLKYFVLGSNGIGKTTLLKQIYSNLVNKMDILMLDQDIQLESTEQTICQFILGADSQLYDVKKRIDELEQKEEMNDNENDEYLRLSEIIYQKEWDKYEAESKRIINGLGFTDSSIPVSILSGGKRMILAIGKALLRKPEILMLDEPTNHLDLDVVIWLTDYLAGYKKTLVIITHQIGLVNSLADVILYVGNPELIGNKVYTIRGHYDRLCKFLEDKEKETNKTYEKFSKRVDELRKKSTPKKDVDEFIKKEGGQRPPKPYTVNITFDDVVELSTKNIIEFKQVEFGYLYSNPIYTKLDISLGMGSRMILVGPNGCGKTTFFKLASNQIKPTEGYVIADERLRVGYYNQQIVDNLPLNLNSIEYLQSLNSKLDINQCRTILGKLGIKKIDNLDLPTNKICNLSGGQKARISFASVQILNPHLILLDEPTNHLDLESIEGLIKSINDFNGGIIIITHDMYLIESIERAYIYQVKLSNIIKFPGNFEEYCETITNK